MGLHLTPWIEKLKIQDKDTARLIPLTLDTRLSEFAWAQGALVREIERQYNLNIPIRIIILKARQLGISTVTEGVLFNWNWMFPGTQSLVLTHETKASQHLFEMTKLMWEEWPAHDLFTEKHNTQKALGWLETRSGISIATARNAGSGRSFTYRAVHCSECAFWEDPETLMTGLNQSVPYVPGTIMIFESTANGVGGWFYDEWYRAVDRESPSIPMFFPWWRHRPYSMPTSLQPADYTKTERDIVRHIQLLHSVEIMPSQLAWRRHKIAESQGDEALFRQEYPVTPEEAFIMTGTSVFPLEAIDSCYQPKKGVRGYVYRDGGRFQFIRDADGPLTIFKEPGDKPWAQYVVAGDPARTVDGDGACAQVINRKTGEQVAVYHGHCEPIQFAHELMHLAYYYNTACLNVEIEGPGHGTIATILAFDYPDVWRHHWMDKAPGKVANSFGWSTNYNRKHAARGCLTDWMCRGSLVIHDAQTYDELRRYVYLGGGEMGPNSKSGHDDAVTSLMIAIASIVYNDPTDDSFGEPMPVTVIPPQMGGTPQLVGAIRAAI